MIRRRSLAALLLAAGGAAAIAGAPAGAQVQLGGTVPSLLGLQVGTPGTFVRRAAGVYELRVPVQITATDDGTSLSIADGEDFRDPGRGRLRDGGRLVSAPLQVSVAGRAPQPLSAPIDPLLATWDRAISVAPATIVLRQSLPSGSITAPGLHKILLITVSSQTP